MRTLVVALAITAAAGCRGREEAARPGAVASILPHAYLVERIAGPHMEVSTLVRPGESPATYQPTDAQVSEILGARVLFRTGVPFENGKWFQSIAGRGPRTVDLREGIELRHLEECDHGPGPDHDHGEEGADPHIWLAPALLAIQAETIAATLSELDPEHADEFDANLRALLDDLATLDEELSELLAPVRGRRIYVYHPSWGYLCDAYGLEQVPIEIEGKEPSDAELTEFQARARADGARIVFVQPQIAGQSARAAARAIGAEVVALDPLAKDVLGNLREAARAIAGAVR
jgi:zinc transport system substrate-binding protein